MDSDFSFNKYSASSLKDPYLSFCELPDSGFSSLECGSSSASTSSLACSSTLDLGKGGSFSSLPPFSFSTPHATPEASASSPLILDMPVVNPRSPTTVPLGMLSSVWDVPMVDPKPPTAVPVGMLSSVRSTLNVASLTTVPTSFSLPSTSFSSSEVSPHLSYLLKSSKPNLKSSSVLNPSGLTSKASSESISSATSSNTSGLTSISTSSNTLGKMGSQRKRKAQSTSTFTSSKTSEKKPYKSRRKPQEALDVPPLILDHFNSFVTWSTQSAKILISDINFVIYDELESNFNRFLESNEEGEIVKWKDPYGKGIMNISGRKTLLKMNKLKSRFLFLTKDNNLTRENILSFKKDYLARLPLLGAKDAKHFLSSKVFSLILDRPAHTAFLKEEALSSFHLAGLVVLHHKQCVATRIWLMQRHPDIMNKIRPEWMMSYYIRQLLITFMYASYIEKGTVSISNGKALTSDFWSNCYLFSKWLMSQDGFTSLQDGTTSSL